MNIKRKIHLWDSCKFCDIFRFSTEGKKTNKYECRLGCKKTLTTFIFPRETFIFWGGLPRKPNQKFFFKKSFYIKMGKEKKKTTKKGKKDKDEERDAISMLGAQLTGEDYSSSEEEEEEEEEQMEVISRPVVVAPPPKMSEIAKEARAKMPKKTGEGEGGKSPSTPRKKSTTTPRRSESPGPKRAKSAYMFFTEVYYLFLLLLLFSLLF